MDFLSDLKHNVYCRLAPSKIHGVGVIAIKHIPAGINPMPEVRESEFDEVPISDIRGADLPPEILKLVEDFCPERPQDGVFDVPQFSLNEIGIAWYLNHSSSPNMRERDGVFFSIRDIEPGEELTVDYGTYGALNL